MDVALGIEREWRKEVPDLLVIEMLSDELVKLRGVVDDNAEGMVDEALVIGGTQIDLDD